jgi:hypothetical protein
VLVGDCRHDGKTMTVLGCVFIVIIVIIVMVTDNL